MARVTDDQPLLSVRDLTVEFSTSEGVVRAVRGITFDVMPGETLGIVGESGSGKSVTMLAIMGLLPATARIVAGQVLFGGRDLTTLPDRKMRSVRGGDIGMVFQDPMSTLNPVLKVGAQISEMLRIHNSGMSKDAARKRVVELLELVGVPDAARRYDEYPHEYSGGMRQRAVIAMAIANGPRILIADEPTTALDVTIQAQVLDVLRDAQAETGSSIILITHDLGVVAEMSDRILVLYGGEIMEEGSIDGIFHAPGHPYTLGLMTSLPRPGKRLDRLLPIRGQPPSLLAPPPGCVFHPRCDLRRGRERCVDEKPALRTLTGDQRAACHFTEEMPQETQRVAAALGMDIVGG